MSAKALRISVIIPAYNEERYLAGCLDSIAAQSVKPFEVIIVDNNSTDRTADIANRYPFVTLMAENQQGLTYARAAGLSAATGDLLVRLDADTRLPKDWLQSLLEIAGQYPGYAGYTGRGTFYDVPLPRFFGFMQVLLYQLMQFPAMRGYTLWGANAVVRREAWRMVRAQCHSRNDIDEDIDMTLQLRKNNRRILFAPELCASMSLHRNAGLLDTVRYVTTWPRDYVINRRYIAALYIIFLTALLVVLSVLAWLPTRPFAHRQNML